MSELKKLKRYSFGTISYERQLKENTQGTLVYDPDHIVDALLQSCRDTRFVISCDPTLKHLKDEPWWKRLDQAINRATGEED